MKNAIKLLGIIALVAIIGFSMAACDDGGGGGGGWSKLEISGKQVYTAEEDFFSVDYKVFNGSRSIITDVGGTGNIATGKLTYSIEIPNASSFVLASANKAELEAMGYKNVVIKPDNAKVWVLYGFATSGSGTDGYLVKENQEYKIDLKNERVTGTYESVMYMYVEEESTISATGGEVEDEDGDPITLQNIKMTLKKGWNPVCSKSTFTYSEDEWAMKLQISLNDPSSTKWVLDEYNTLSVKGPMFLRLPSKKFGK